MRIRFAKRGKVRFISHRDVARAFERAFRIEELPLAFTQGFSPRPKVSFGLALSVGHESDAEYLDVELSEPVDTDVLAERLSAALPEGIDVTGAVRLVDRAPALQESITEVQYRVEAVDGLGRPVAGRVLDTAASHALASDELARHPHPQGPGERGRHPSRDPEHRGRARRRQCRCSSSPCRRNPAVPVPVRCSTPSSFVGIVLTEHRVLRTAQWIERDGARLEPLEADVFAPALEASAS